MKKLFYNGIIRTMRENEIVQAVLTDGNKIVSVGTYDEMFKLAPRAELIDLKGSTMLPAFIDAHSHLSSYAMSFLQVPLEECCSYKEIADRISTFILQNHIKAGAWVIAKGYDHNVLTEKQHPGIEFLDSIAPSNPLILQHKSGHVGVCNSMALAKLGIAADTPSPDGGKIGVLNGKLTGYLEENAFIETMKKVPMSSMEDMVNAYRKAQESYAAHGITTIQEGMTVSQMFPLYQYLTANKLFFLDLVAYLMPEDAEAFLKQYPQSVRNYHEHFKIGGLKIVLDGSPQGRTAWMRTPYLSNDNEQYYGYGVLPDNKVKAAIEQALDGNVQILAHCNGDAAAEQYISALETINKERTVSKIRPVMIHAQLLGIDQLARVKAIGIIPSFFVAHVYHWGDVHIQNFGLERAMSISPTGSAIKHQILFTFHQDTPVIEPDMLETIWCAVNRVTKQGVVLGKNERISVMDALKAVTINAAYQYGEENEKGSIEAGKVADFVILDKDPLDIEPMDIRDIHVMQTIKDAKTIFECK